MYNPLSDPAVILALATFFLVFSGLAAFGLYLCRKTWRQG